MEQIKLGERLLLGVTEASAYTGVAVPTLRLWIRRGQLPVVRAGRRVLLQRQMLEERAASGQLVPPAAKKVRTA